MVVLRVRSGIVVLMFILMSGLVVMVAIGEVLMNISVGMIVVVVEGKNKCFARQENS